MSRKNICLAFTAIVMVLLTTTATAIALYDGYVCDHGYHTFGDYVLNGGVGNYGYTDRYYWVDEDAFTSRQLWYIADAVDSWVFTTDDIGVTTSISVLETDEQSSSSFDFYSEYLGSTVLARTEFWTYSTHQELTEEGALTSNYGYTKIIINTDNSYMDDRTQFTSTTAHEFGHAIGLSHRNTEPSSIMCQTRYDRTAERASASDLRTVNHLYD